MHRDEREARVRELEEWQRQQSAEFDGQPFPPEVREQWTAYQNELNEHRLALDELRERDELLRRLWERGGSNLEPGAGEQPYRRSDVATAQLPPYRRAALEGGLRAVERHSKALSGDAGRRLETLLRQDDAQGLAGRWLAAVGDPHYNAAFGKLLMDPTHGHLRMEPAEVEAMRTVGAIMAERAMSIGTDAAGGFAVPFQLDPTIMISSGGVINPLRRLATVRQVAANELHLVSSDGVTAAYAPEGTEVDDNTPVLAGPVVKCAMGQSFVPFSMQLGDDWATLQQELGRLFTDARDTLDATKMLTGSGTDEPEGLLTGATTTVATGGTGSFVVGDLYALKEAMPGRWISSSTWLASPTMLDTIFRFVASADSTEPQIMPAGRGGDLLGRPVGELSTMATAAASGNKVAVLGDLSEFVIADRIGSSVELVPHLLGANRRPTGQRGLYFRWRSGSKVAVPNAFRVLAVQ